MDQPTTEKKLELDDDVDAIDTDLCFICVSKPIVVIGECGHKTICEDCFTMSSLLFENRLCITCQSDFGEVVISKKCGLAPDSLTMIKSSRKTMLFSRRVKAHFDNPNFKNKVEKSISSTCPQCSQTFPNLNSLKSHASSQHNLEFCNICLSKRRVFSKRQRLYERGTLQEHRLKGDKAHGDEGAIPAHIKCKYCREWCYDITDHHNHMIQKHECCQVCRRLGRGELWISNDAALIVHYSEEHLICDFAECVSKPLENVFEDELSLQSHILKIHGHLISKEDRKAASKVSVGFIVGDAVEPALSGGAVVGMPRRGGSVPTQKQQSESPRSSRSSQGTSPRDVGSREADYPSLGASHGVASHSSITGGRGSEFSHAQTQRVGATSTSTSSFAVAAAHRKEVEEEYPTLGNTMRSPRAAGASGSTKAGRESGGGVGPGQSKKGSSPLTTPSSVISAAGHNVVVPVDYGISPTAVAVKVHAAYGARSLHQLQRLCGNYLGRKITPSEMYWGFRKLFCETGRTSPFNADSAAPDEGKVIPTEGGGHLADAAIVEVKLTWIQLVECLSDFDLRMELQKQHYEAVRSGRGFGVAPQTVDHQSAQTTAVKREGICNDDSVPTNNRTKVASELKVLMSQGDEEVGHMLDLRVNDDEFWSSCAVSVAGTSSTISKRNAQDAVDNSFELPHPNPPGLSSVSYSLGESKKQGGGGLKGKLSVQNPRFQHEQSSDVQHCEAGVSSWATVAVVANKGGLAAVGSKTGACDKGIKGPAVVVPPPAVWPILRPNTSFESPTTRNLGSGDLTGVTEATEEKSKNGQKLQGKKKKKVLLFQIGIQHGMG